MAPVAFQIMSDLHLETYTSYDFPFKQTAPNLALLGDVGHVGDDGLFAFLEKQLRRYWNVFFLLGNHEPVMGSWDTAKTKMRMFTEKMDRLRGSSTTGRFVFLDQTRYDFDTVTILGCTLFSNVTREQSGDVGNRLIDFKQILNWTVADHVEAHASDLKWLNAQVSEVSKTSPGRQIVILTHHSPSLDSRAVDPRHSVNPNPVQSGFATDLSGEECGSNKAVVMWAFGHTHYNCDFIDDMGKRLVGNQRGYASSLESDFDPPTVFLVGCDGTVEEGNGKAERKVPSMLDV